ncbi:MAG: DUF3592 domain-containing protein [Bacteroidia bacterium]|nr:DUF3592 domain-containing protein [Bacteroidia bacterium]
MKQKAPRKPNTALGLAVAGAAVASMVGLIIYFHIVGLGQPGLWMDCEDEDTENTRGKVLRKMESSGKSTTYTIYFSYHLPSGEEIQDEQKVDFNTWFLAREGEEIDICYLKDSPRRVLISGNDYGSLSVVMVAFMDLLILIAAIALYRNYRKNYATQDESDRNF